MFEVIASGDFAKTVVSGDLQKAGEGKLPGEMLYENYKTDLP
jgi:hypothetical protein